MALAEITITFRVVYDPEKTEDPIQCEKWDELFEKYEQFDVVSADEVDYTPPEFDYQETG